MLVDYERGFKLTKIARNRYVIEHVLSGIRRMINEPLTYSSVKIHENYVMKELMAKCSGGKGNVVFEKDEVNDVYVLRHCASQIQVSLDKYPPTRERFRAAYNNLIRKVEHSGNQGLYGQELDGTVLGHKRSLSTSTTNKENKMGTKPARRFCVIGVFSGQAYSGVNRNWYDTEKGAIEHAENLLRNHRDRHRDGDKLFVVEVTSVVELDPRPIEIRKPIQGDFAAEY